MFKTNYEIGKLYKATFIIHTEDVDKKCMSFFVLKSRMTDECAKSSLTRIIDNKLNSDEYLKEIIDITEQSNIPIYEEKIFKE